MVTKCYWIAFSTFQNPTLAVVFIVIMYAERKRVQETVPHILCAVFWCVLCVDFRCVLCVVICVLSFHVWKFIFVLYSDVCCIFVCCILVWVVCYILCVMFFKCFVLKISICVVCRALMWVVCCTLCVVFLCELCVVFCVLFFDEGCGNSCA